MEHFLVFHHRRGRLGTRSTNEFSTIEKCTTWASQEKLKPKKFMPFLLIFWLPTESSSSSFVENFISLQFLPRCVFHAIFASFFWGGGSHFEISAIVHSYKKLKQKVPLFHHYTKILVQCWGFFVFSFSPLRIPLDLCIECFSRQSEPVH